MKTRKSTKVRSHRRQLQERTEREMLLDEFKIHLNTAFATPEGPARSELVSIIRRSNHNLRLAIADVLVPGMIRKALIQPLEDSDMEAAASQIILGKRKAKASRNLQHAAMPDWFVHVHG